MNRNARLTQIFVGSMVLAALASATYAGLQSHTLRLVQAAALLGLAAATSRMKVKLPGIAGIMASVSDTMGWLTALAVFPVMYAIHRSYRLYFANAAEAPRLASLSRVARAGA